MNIVLFEPEIPQNTGNIVRTCAATNAKLHLIELMGFSMDDKHLKRAGLDYWDLSFITRYPGIEAFLSARAGGRFFFATTKADHAYTEIDYQEEDYLFFGPETRGLPETLLSKVYGQAIRIPMREGIRSLNLSNSVAIVLYEALRQQSFKGLDSKGTLTGRQEKQLPWLELF